MTPEQHKEIMKLVKQYGEQLKTGTRKLDMSSMSSTALAASFKHDAGKWFSDAARTLVKLEELLTAIEQKVTQ